MVADSHHNDEEQDLDMNQIGQSSSYEFRIIGQCVLCSSVENDSNGFFLRNSQSVRVLLE